MSELKLRPSKSLLLKIGGGLGEVGGAAEVAPIVLVGAEGEDFLALGGEAEVGGDDGEDAFFGEHGEEAGRDDMDAGEGEGVKKWRVASDKWRVGRKTRGIPRFARNDTSFIVDVAATELEVVVEEELAPGVTGLDG